ncbi:MAG TPA: tetratricopeptide repeat protein, partial [Caulobacteraceae bacterium]|nr:tetratricopeptide repeat protein [Caulobacteraceae bacterium]
MDLRDQEGGRGSEGPQPGVPAGGDDPIEAATALWVQGDKAAAVDMLKTALAALQVSGGPKRQFRNLYRKTLYSLCELERWPEARDLSLAAIERFPAIAMGYRFLGEALFRLGDLDSAKAAFEAALERDPTEGTARMALALLRRG